MIMWSKFSRTMIFCVRPECNDIHWRDKQCYKNTLLKLEPKGLSCCKKSMALMPLWFKAEILIKLCFNYLFQIDQCPEISMHDILHTSYYGERKKKILHYCIIFIHLHFTNRILKKKHSTWLHYQSYFQIWS